jgi:hypothetical protein
MEEKKKTRHPFPRTARTKFTFKDHSMKVISSYKSVMVKLLPFLGRKGV